MICLLCDELALMIHAWRMESHSNYLATLLFSDASFGPFQPLKHTSFFPRVQHLSTYLPDYPDIRISVCGYLMVQLYR